MGAARDMQCGAPGGGQADQELQAQRDLARRYVDIAGVILLALDADETVAMINRKGCEVLQCREGQIVGKSWFDCFIPARCRENIRAVFNRLMAGEVEPAEYYENPVLTCSGEERIIAWHNSVLKDAEGRITGTLTSGEDVTERRRAEEALAQRSAELEATNKELDAFAHSVAHHLRAPLRSIDGFSRNILDDCLDRLGARAKDYLRRIRAAAERMATIMDDLLDLSGIARKDMKRQGVDLSALVNAVAAELREADPGRQVEVVVQPGVKADGDPGLLRIALERMLDNAWKFSATRSRARIEFGASDVEGERVYFVRDDGVGFDTSSADRLFQPFQRLEGSAGFPGTGIGLVAVRRIVARHGGRVWAEGRKDDGATFYFTLE